MDDESELDALHEGDSLEEYLENAEPAPDDFSENFDPDCVRKIGNFASYDSRFLFDYNGDRVPLTRERLQYVSPKLLRMLDEIGDQDRRDIEEHGHTFKHFIFSNIKSGTGGAKIIATALIDILGMHLGYLRDVDELMASKGDNFFLMSSVAIYKKNIPVKKRKEMLSLYNSRPDNVHGDLARIIVMDGGFKEGIDLFDVKYVHIFEPQTTLSDQKQVIGRATRTCGQKGLDFHPNRGWPLYVNIYDSAIPEETQFKFMGGQTIHHMYLTSLGLDMRMLELAADMDRVYIKGAIDYYLNKPIHDFSIGGSQRSNECLHGGGSKSKDKMIYQKEMRDLLNFTRNNNNMIDAIVNIKKRKTAKAKITAKMPIKLLETELHDLITMTRDSRLIGALMNETHVEQMPQTHEGMQEYIKENFEEYKWPNVKMENLCNEQSGGSRINEQSGGENIRYTPTQNFVRRYFTPENDHKGILFAHSVGTGKTCSAIATATTSFEKEGYTILWVTRTTLKSDIWKNMFDQICSDSLRNVHIPTDTADRMKLLSKSWSIRPMSYKQFSNLVSGKNSMHAALVKKNGSADPLRKTLIIIDEAHKLYGETDLSHLERPDMEAFKESILRSYEISGADSVRLILMTATPITKSPMELVKLINLCKERHDRMEDEFNVFSEQYLDETGKFSERGESHFLDHISGHISYLNREKDARMFAQPIVKFIEVPLLERHILYREYDAPLLRAIEKPKIDEIEKRIKEDLANLTDKYKGITAKSFASINRICETQAKKKDRTACKKLARSAIKDVMEYVKDQKKGVKEEGKELREILKHAKATLKAKTDEIKKRTADNRTAKNTSGGSSEEQSKQKFREKQDIKDIDTDYQKYVQSAFYNVRTKCRIPAKRNVFNDYPVIVHLNDQKESFKTAIKEKENDMREFTKNLRTGFKEMKKVIKEPELLTLKKIEMKQRISAMAIERRHKIEELNKQIAKRDRTTRKLKATLERRYKKSLKQKEKDLKDINRETEKIDKKNREFQDLLEIEEEDLREFVKNKYLELVDELKKEE
jgi:hypothetical protein